VKEVDGSYLAEHRDAGHHYGTVVADMRAAHRVQSCSGVRRAAARAISISAAVRTLTHNSVGTCGAR